VDIQILGEKEESQPSIHRDGEGDRVEEGDSYGKRFL